MNLSINSAEFKHLYYKNMVIAIFLACFGYFIFNISDALIKVIASDTYHVSQKITIIMSAKIILLGAYGLLFNRKIFKPNQPKLLLTRAITSQVNTILLILAITHVTLANFYTVIFTAPLWVSVLSAYFLKDKIGKNQLAALLIGLASIIFMFRPGSEIVNIWSVLLLIGAIFIAINTVLVRKMGTKESKSLIIITTSALTVAIHLPIALFNYTAMPIHDLIILASAGVISSIGALMTTYAYQTASSASLIAPFHYTQIVWGSIIGFFFFNETPSHSTMIGSIVIVLSGLMLVYTEKPSIQKTEQVSINAKFNK